MLRRLLVLLFALVAPAFVGGADGAADPASAQAEFNKVLGDWKELIARLRELQERYQLAPENQKASLQAEYATRVAEGRTMVPRLAAAAEGAYAAAPNADKDLTEFLSRKLADDVQSDNYEDAARVTSLLIAGGSKDKTIYSKAGVAAFAVHDFPAAREYLRRASDLGELDDQGKLLLTEVDRYQQYWEKEQEIRKAEAEADNLPRVKLVTNKGDIIVELFENEAPIATANFINLVENHYYDGTKFSRVVPGLLAQGGAKEDAKAGLGYNIPGEAERKDHRVHFRGSLSMAVTTGPDTAGSQFALSFIPTVKLNGKFTVFGRVIQGMDVLAKLERTEANQRPRRVTPDGIETATVLRKRDHSYEPTKLPLR